MAATEITARPRQGARRPRAEREVQMLDVAAAMFADKGFHATSMDDIAAACGVTKPMVYSYFGSKHRLLEAIIDRSGRFLLDALSALGRDGAEAEAAMRHTVQLLIIFLFQQPARWRLAFTALRSGDEVVSRRVLAYRQGLLENIIDSFARFAPDGMNRATARLTVTPYAYALLGAAEAGADWWLSTPAIGPDEAERMALNVLDALIGVVRRELGA